MELSDFLTGKPEVIWLIVIIGAVAVIGITDFIKNWVSKKAAKWIVFFVSLLIAFILSPLVPSFISTIIILWLLILSVSTMARNSIVDGLPYLIGKLMGAVKNIGDTK